MDGRDRRQLARAYDSLYACRRIKSWVKVGVGAGRQARHEIFHKALERMRYFGEGVFSYRPKLAMGIT